MSGSTTFAAIKYAEAADEVNKFPVNVSEPGAKTIDKFLEEHTLTIKKRAAGYTATSGEWGIQEKTGETTTLPAATANALVGVYTTVAEAKVTTSGGAFIEGDFITAVSKTATVVLTTGQHILLLANGTNWQIVSGEVKREGKYAIFNITKAEIEAGFEFSAIRMVAIGGASATPSAVTVGGAEVKDITNALVPPGQKVKGTTAEASITFNALLL